MPPREKPDGGLPVGITPDGPPGRFRLHRIASSRNVNTARPVMLVPSWCRLSGPADRSDKDFL